MKKFLALLISVVMVLGLVAFPAAAEGEVIFTVETVEGVNPGDDVTVKVTLTGGDYEAHTLQATLEYDPNCLQATGSHKLAVLNTVSDLDGLCQLNHTAHADQGQVELGVVCPEQGLTAHGELFSVDFHVKDNCNVNQAITLTIRSFMYSPVGGSQTAIPYIVVNGGIKDRKSVV